MKWLYDKDAEKIVKESEGEYQEFLRPSEVAEILGVVTKTVQRWTENGRLHAAGVTLGGHNRYKRSDVEAAIRRAAMRQDTDAIAS